MYLIDSHVLLWLVADDAQLGRQTRTVLTASPMTFVSAVTVIELTIKAMNGRLVIPGSARELLEQQGLTPLPVTAEHGTALRAFPELASHDPFDRLLLAQAKTEHLTFLTADRLLLDLGYDWIVDARL